MITNKEQDNVTFEQFEDLFKVYYPIVVRRIIRVVRNQAEAEDIAQTVFIQLYHTDWKGIENIPAWLTKAGLYAAYNHIRTEKRLQNRAEKEATEVREEVSPSSEEKWLHHEEIEDVRHVLKEMDERDRLLLLMKYSGFSYQDLAQAANIEASSVGTLLSRAKKKFRTMYKRMRGYEM